MITRFEYKEQDSKHIVWDSLLNCPFGTLNDPKFTYLSEDYALVVAHALNVLNNEQPLKTDKKYHDPPEDTHIKFTAWFVVREDGKIDLYDSCPMDMLNESEEWFGPIITSIKMPSRIKECVDERTRGVHGRILKDEGERRPKGED